jgi:hypothetical protein
LAILEKRFLPGLRAAQAEISASFPDVRAETWSQTFGPGKGHVIGLACVFPNARIDQPDNVSLDICFGLRDPICTIDANVIWGHPGQLEAEVWPRPVPLTEEAIQRIESELPRLLQVLREAVQRGMPIQ